VVSDARDDEAPAPDEAARLLMRPTHAGRVLRVVVEYDGTDFSG
jgi:hypothetical protein